MKTGLVIGGIAAAAAIAFGVYMVDIDQTQEATLPNVTVEGGQLPEFDAEVGEINVTEEEVTVTVPDVNIVPPSDDGSVASN